MYKHALNMFGLCLGALLITGTAPAAELFVAPDGNDTGAGTKDKPLATLEGARNAVRALKKTGAAAQPITITFRAGVYAQSRVVEFAAEDSGTASTPILYRAEPGAVVRVSGGREVANWKPVTDTAILNRLPAAARGAVRVADLRAQGITDFGKLGVRGFGTKGGGPAEAELFYNDLPMTLARWPNGGFRGLKVKTDDQTVVVDTDQLARWTGETEPWIFAYWHHDWAEIYEPIRGIDAASHTLKRSPDIKPQYGITAARARWYAFNLLSELDSPGEYFLDRQNGRLYFWPPQPGARAVLSMSEGLIRGEKLAYVTFRGFTAEACRGTAISLKDSTGCQVVGCTVRNAGHQGVNFSGGERDQVVGCDVYFTGEGGISMTGGQRPTLTPAHHNAENNHVHHYARRARTYRSAIAISGVGNRIAHNLIHDGPHMALAAGGNDHIVEYNEIHNTVEESGDAGSYYVGRDWTARGNILRYNYWHETLGATGYGGMTIYLDDQHCGHTIYGNLFVNCMQALFFGGGDDNVATNNVFINCPKAAHLDNRGLGWQKKATDDPKGELRSKLTAVPYTNALWRARYPTLVNILQDDPGTPKRNVFAGNIAAGAKWEDITASIRQFQVITNNLAFEQDKEWIRLTKSPTGQPMRLDFKDPAAVKAIGYVPLPLEKMGLYADDRRASWPVMHVVRPVKFPPPKPKSTAKK